jgi:hypothetical protein
MVWWVYTVLGWLNRLVGVYLDGCLFLVLGIYIPSGGNITKLTRNISMLTRNKMLLTRNKVLSNRIRISIFTKIPWKKGKKECSCTPFSYL